MTNGWVDIRNADVILAMGGNPAENHPCGFKWFIEAKKTRGAKIIVVDPRFTRTAAVADFYCPIRPGTDVVYLLVQRFILSGMTAGAVNLLRAGRVRLAHGPQRALPGRAGLCWYIWLGLTLLGSRQASASPTGASR